MNQYQYWNRNQTIEGKEDRGTKGTETGKSGNLRTDKLKGAATDAGQLPLRAVWVLFSEVENKIVRMQERGFARPNTLTWRWSPTTEMVTAQQIQEIKHAYEQQYRKLSEFTDFIGRYSSYVEKQTSLINFLRDWLGSMTK